MKITDKNKLNETELTLAIPEELLEKGKEVAEATKEDEMFPFTLRYDASRTADLKIMLRAADVHPEKEAENSVTAYMNMAQLQLLKGLEFVEQVIAEDTGHRKELIDFICQEGPVPAASRTETEAETIRPVNHVDANSEGAVAEAAAGDHAVAAMQSSCCGCPTNRDMESAQMISVGSYVSGCICCPGAEQWFGFTVPVSKTYTIYTSGSLDTIGPLLDCCGNVLATNDDYAGKLNFRMIQNLTAGTTYYVRVRAFGNTTGSYTFRVTDSIFASGVSISQTSITLEKDVLYELPVTPNYTYKGYLGAKRIPGLSVSVIPANADEQKVWWWEHYDGVLKCSYGWDDDGDRYIHVTAKKLGASKLYARDWNENGRRGECTVTATEGWSECQEPTIYSRESWGARNIVEDRLVERTKQPEMIIFHHTADKFQSTDTSQIIAEIKKIQKKHIDDRGKCDIAYHFIIDPAGGIWQGAKIDEYQRGHAEGHFNDIGVALLGDFEKRFANGWLPNTLNENQKAAMKSLSKWLCYRYDLPFDRVNRVSPITTHKAASGGTECPGDNVEPWVETTLEEYITNWHP